MSLRSRTIRKLSKKKKGKDLSYGDPLRAALVCRVKDRAYATLEEAETDLQRLIDDEGFDPATQTFPCTHCGWFHIGRPRPGQERIMPPSEHQLYRKKADALVYAVQMTDAFVVMTLHGPVDGKPGDFYVTSTERDDDSWPVDQERFLATYQPVEEP